MTNDTDYPNELDPAALAYFKAVEQRDLEALVAAFTSTAEIIDVNRSIKGQSMIRSWASNEVIGGHYHILTVTPTPSGQDVLLEFTPPGANAGFRASYKFDMNDGKIQRANLQYAN